MVGEMTMFVHLPVKRLRNMTALQTADQCWTAAFCDNIGSYQYAS
jgi:hypothetical protein